VRGHFLSATAHIGTSANPPHTNILLGGLEMARLRFIKGTITGRLGEFVGSRWKGINYIKVFTPPSNPRTEAQVSVRTVFRFISAWATALFSKGLFAYIPSASRMTERNSVFKANAQMLTNKVFVPADLQVARANFSPVATVNTRVIYTPSDGELQADFTIGWSPSVDRSGLDIHAFIYDSGNNRIVGYENANARAGLNDFVFDVGTGLLMADLHCFFFVAGLDDKKKLLSKTYRSAVTAN
jgi:hypothetical protein